jgi:Ca-activated chloride channel family protein
MLKRGGAQPKTPVQVASLAVLILASTIAIPARDIVSGQTIPADYHISVDVGLVVLPVAVTDRKGRAVAGLNENSFRVLDDGHPQKITLFESEDVPVTVGLVIDNSGSMWPKRPEVLAAAEDFARSSNPQDQIFVVNFNQSVSMGLPKELPFTSNVQDLLAAISRSRPEGNTALYDGVGVALQHMKAGAESRRALVVISDGGDNSSSLSFAGLLRRAEASSAQIYTIGIFDDSFAGENSGVLRRLAKVTGGQAYFPKSPSEIPGICQEIAQKLRHQYTIGYRPGGLDQAGRYHAIHVTAQGAGAGRLRVSTRAGYVASPNAAMFSGPA